MKKIPLSKTGKVHKGKYTLVDDEDYEYLMQWNWYAIKSAKCFYAKRVEYSKGRSSERVFPMQNVVMKVTDKKLMVDHINMDGLDNRKSNLRIATRSQNGMNRRKSINCTSKYKGVHLKYKNGWICQIRFNNKQKHLGVFKNEKAAAKAYDKAAIELHGEFASLNFKVK